MDTKVKILIAGDVRGKLDLFFKRLESINQKSGPFEILFCVGDFFGDADPSYELRLYRNGSKHITVPTFILGPKPKCKDQARFYANLINGEICENLTYLGKRGLYTLSAGVKIAYLSGLETPTSTTNADAIAEECYFTKEDVAAVRNSCLVSKGSISDYRGVDILLTSQWPVGIVEDNENASKLISFLAKEIRPRYHFCGLQGKFLEIAPFRIPTDNTTQLELSTRFIGLADFGNAAKERYLYAMNVTPVSKMRAIDLLQKDTNEIKCPYLQLDFRGCYNEKSEHSDNGQYFFDMRMQGNSRSDNNRKRFNGGGKSQDKRPRILNIDQEKCWFCLSSANVEKHLVISVGENFYLALAKGPINDFHVLILSITHIPCAALLTDGDWQELTKFKQALQKFFKDQGQVVCFTERNYKSSHLQINALGIDEGYAWKIKHAFEDKAEEFNLQLETLPALTDAQMLPNRGPYFVAELPDDTTLLTRQMKHFPLHFARDVFCSENLLNCDEKVDWKECKLEKDEEIEMVNTFRAKFAKYDFTL